MLKSTITKGINNPMYGKKSARNGVVLTEETKRKISKAHKGKVGLIGDKNPMYGKVPHNKGTKASKESIEKGIRTRKANYDKLPDDIKQIKKDAQANAMVERVIRMKKSDTKPERITEKILIDINRSYQKQVKIGYYLCDFMVDNKIIEVQGDYWHCNPKIYKKTAITETQKKNQYRDKAKKTYLTNKKYDILYLWEYDLVKNVEMCENMIIDFLK